MEEENISQEENMTKSEAWNFKEFANAFMQGMGGYGFYSPFTQQQNLLELNNDPLVPTYDKILRALANNPIDAKTLCGYSEFMEVFDSIYGGSLRYLESLLSIDLYWGVKNIKDPKIEYQSEEYKKDLRRVYKFLDSFDYKQEFRKVIKEVLRKETVYTYFRDSMEIDSPIDIDSEETKIKKAEKFGLQILPQKYCRTTGYFDNSNILFDFDMNYFMRGTTDINLFAPSFKRKFRELYDDSNKPYNPSNQLNDRNSVFALYVQQSPIDGAWAFKTDLSNFRQTPPLASLMKDCFRNTDVENLQFDKNALSARALIAGTIRLLDNQNGAKTKNSFAIDPVLLGQLLDFVSASAKKNVTPLPFPTEDNKFFQFTDSNKTMVEDSIVNSARKGVSASSLIYSDEKMMAFEMQQAVETDYTFMAHSLYSQFSNFLNFFVNRKTVKYKFDFVVNGCDRLFYREQQRKGLEQMYANGLIPNTSYMASVYGIKPQMFDRMLEESKYSGLQDKLSMLLNKNTMSGVGGKEVGNQVKDQTERTDSAEISQDYEGE